MNKEILFEILVRWNSWGRKSIEKLQDRTIVHHIIPYLDDAFPLALIGIRRSGKSSILSLLMRHLTENEAISPTQLLLLNFEEPLFTPHLSIEFLEHLVSIYRERINPDKKIYFFLDEIQNLQGWEKWVRREADLKEHKIILTGSSSKLMSSEIATLLTGRHITFKIMPIDFEEFLIWQNIPFQTEIDRIENKPIIRKCFSEYLEWGGLPEINLTENKEKRNRILHQYFDDILFRDIVLRYQIRDAQLLQRLAEYYMTNLASLHSFNRIRNIFETSLDNIRRYTHFLEESQLIYLLHKFSFKLSDQQKSNRKIYVTDTGLRNSISFRFSQDTGKLYENVVANYFKNHADEMYYFANGGECDFVIKQEGKFFPVQVSASDLSDKKLFDREIQGLISAMQYLKQKEGLLLSDDLEQEIMIEENLIRIKPVWKFLLNKTR
jgi:predicted AAA+ superfamily ATPase